LGDLTNLGVSMEDILLQVSNDYKIAKEKLVKSNFSKGITAFGSARIPMDDPHIKEIEEISTLCAKRVLEKNKKISFITGGGPSVMTAWLSGAHSIGAETGGIALMLPHEKPEDQLRFCNKDTSCTMQTFEARKALLIEYSKAIIIFKGGFGTMDELFATLTLMKTGKIPEIPIFIYPSDFYKDILNFKSFIDAKTVKQSEIEVLKYMDTKEELLERLYGVIDGDA
jgi:uncharacterized protein (TIGR00730 family)